VPPFLEFAELYKTIIDLVFLSPGKKYRKLIRYKQKLKFMNRFPIFFTIKSGII